MRRHHIWELLSMRFPLGWECLSTISWNSPAGCFLKSANASGACLPVSGNASQPHLGMAQQDISPLVGMPPHHVSSRLENASAGSLPKSGNASGPSSTYYRVWKCLATTSSYIWECLGTTSGNCPVGHFPKSANASGSCLPVFGNASQPHLGMAQQEISRLRGCLSTTFPHIGE